jgi:NADH-quinone oxidoreductase subunit N
MTEQDLRLIAPLVSAIGLAVVLLLVDLAAPGRRFVAVAVSLVGLGVVALATLLAHQSPGDAFAGAYRVDALTTFLDLLFISIVGLTIVFAPDYLEPRGLPIAEFAIVLVFAMTGAMLIAASTDLLLLFLGL